LSEHNYGIAFLFFPLFALGFRPLTVHGIAVLIGFVFSGYGAFRLARTLTLSDGVAWIAGITFAFIPYRFGQLPHVNYLFAGWIPILIEALVLFLRERSRRRAAWLAVAFFMNALTCVHWFVLTLIPLALTAIILLRHGDWRDRTLWRRGVVALGVASVALIPFLLPYAEAAHLYGFVRNPQEALFYSAKPLDWFVGEHRNRIWHGLNETIRQGEKALFPGLSPLLLALAAVFLVKPSRQDEGRMPVSKKVLVFLDVAAITCGILMITISGFGYFKLRVFGFYLFEIYSTVPVGIALTLVLVTRILIAYPEIIKDPWQKNLFSSLRSNRRCDAFWVGAVWGVIGFLGSLGMNSFFHRFLYDYVPLFRSVRVPARWAMICCLGLALLAGLGAKQLYDLLARHWPKIHPAPIYVMIALALLIEQRSTPLKLIHGAVDPDALTLWFKQTPMAGGIVELPATTGKMDIYLYTLRAADHGRPLVTAVSGFETPISVELQSLTHEPVIPDRFIDLLESIPCSYLVVHNTLLEPANRLAIESVLAKAIALKRVHFIRSYEGEDLYAVTKTEPNAKSEGQPPFPIPATDSTTEVNGSKASNASTNPIDDARFFVRTQFLDLLDREPDSAGWDYWTNELVRCGNASKCLEEQRARVAAAFFAGQEFQDTGFFVYRLYKATLGRMPTYQDFKADRAKLVGSADLKVAKRALVQQWVKRPQFTRLYPSKLTTEQLVDALLANISATSGFTLDYLKPKLIGESGKEGSRVRIVQELAEDDGFSRNENDRATVLMFYFGFLKRDPEVGGLSFWMDVLAKHHPPDSRQIAGAFIGSTEYRSRFGR
jgi:hypothetical protein